MTHRAALPFRLRELHPDNDSAILNQLLFEYCKQNHIALSRSRPLKKNDNCWVEQKNRTHVRQVLGYHRLTGELQRCLIAELYWAWAQWRNFFQPVMRLSEKTRLGAKVHRRYDQTATPYQRLLDSGQLSSTARAALERRYDGLSPKSSCRSFNRNNSNSLPFSANPMPICAAVLNPVRLPPS